MADLRKATLVLACTTLLSSHHAFGQFVQQGPKLSGSDAYAGGGSGAQQGSAVSISADGNTAIVGGPGDGGYAGAAWIFTRDKGVWAQQGNKLVGSGASGTSTPTAMQGYSVALSADGNTAIVGGIADNVGVGAAWIWTRSKGSWAQQGEKLVGSGAAGIGQQGLSVALSADGNTAIVGAPQDNSKAGAAWVFTRNGTVWSQQGTKLVGSGAVGSAMQGFSVSLSGDGNTAIIGGPVDNDGAGAAWVWTRSGGVWSQQGLKLVGWDTIGSAQQALSVSLSADGNTAIVGGHHDNVQTGAAWIWTRSGGVWTQQGTKLLAWDASGAAVQGQSVALSGDGNTAIVGGDDGTHAGAFWIWKRNGSSWSQQGSRMAGSGAVGNALQGSSVSISADGKTAIVGGRFDNNYAGAAWIFAAGDGLIPPRRRAIKF